MKRWQIRALGGPGSGHFGHAGVPGKRGGSLPRSSAMSIRTGKDWEERWKAARQPKPAQEKWESTIRDNLRKYTTSARREELIDTLVRDFPKALDKAGVKPSEVEELWVYGSFAGSKEIPGDMDLVCLTTTKEYPTWDWVELAPGIPEEAMWSDVWDQMTHDTPITFVNHTSVLKDFLGEISEHERASNYDAPMRVL